MQAKQSDLSQFALKDLPVTSYIDGAFIKETGTGWHPTYDPASGEVLTSIAIADEVIVDAAVESSVRALKVWRAMLPAERARALMRVAHLIRRDAEFLAKVESLDSGKPLREAKGDIETSARYFEYYAGVADKFEGTSIPLGPNFMSFTVREAVGVTAHIIPWNFPLVTTARGVAPALAAGCTAVVKPAEQTPLSALLLGPLMEEAGIPRGVYNVVAGPGSTTGSPLVSHSKVAHVTFTGSVSTGKRVMHSAADHVASVTLELGGKSPIVVLGDADLDAAAEGVMKAIFMNAGQVCSCGSRLIVEKSIAPALLDKVIASAKAMKGGRGIDNPEIGPLVSDRQLATVAGYVQKGRERGLEALCGGDFMKVPGLEGGYFYQPTLLMCPDASDPVVQEEIFGPVLAVQVAQDFEEVMALANGTDFGLVAGIYSKDASKGLRFARDVDAGQVFINQYFAGGVETPFGGTRNSGFGREKGLAALQNYSRLKTITSKI
jgi:acyl-CoA reductase-like NAD-dependent aldehyde dehydrogenase